MNEQGFYFAYDLREAFGLALSIVYMKEFRDFQISMTAGFLTIAVGYKF